MEMSEPEIVLQQFEGKMVMEISGWVLADTENPDDQKWFIVLLKHAFILSVFITFPVFQSDVDHNHSDYPIFLIMGQMTHWVLPEIVPKV